MSALLAYVPIPVKAHSFNGPLAHLLAALLVVSVSALLIIPLFRAGRRRHLLRVSTIAGAVVCVAMLRGVFHWDVVSVGVGRTMVVVEGGGGAMSIGLTTWAPAPVDAFFWESQEYWTARFHLFAFSAGTYISASRPLLPPHKYVTFPAWLAVLVLFAPLTVRLLRRRRPGAARGFEITPREKVTRE